VPGIVLVHGLGCSHRYFSPLASALSDLSLAAPDLPGFGGTVGPPQALDVRGLSIALARWLHASGNVGAMIVANSVGCQVVVDLAAHSPRLIGPAVLVGPTMDAQARNVAAQAWRLATNLGREHPSLLPVLAADYLRCGRLRYMRTMHHALHDRIEDKIASLAPGSVVVRGERDPIASREWGEALADRMGAELVELPDAGHTLNWSAPDELAEVVRAVATQQVDSLANC